jgi:hypothetical protein
MGFVVGLAALLIGLTTSSRSAVLKTDTASASMLPQTTLVHGHVVDVKTEPYPTRPQHTRTRYQLIIWTSSPGAGLAQQAGPQVHEGSIIDVVMPGGERGGRMTVVAGVRHLTLGDEVVLNIQQTPWGLSPLGYALGTVVLRRDNAGALLLPEEPHQHPLLRWLRP